VGKPRVYYRVFQKKGKKIYYAWKRPKKDQFTEGTFFSTKSVRQKKFSTRHLSQSLESHVEKEFVLSPPYLKAKKQEGLGQ